MTFIDTVASQSCHNYIAMVNSSNLIEPSKGFYFYWVADASDGTTPVNLTVSNVKVSYGVNTSNKIPCNEVLTLSTNLAVLSPEIMIDSCSEIIILTNNNCYLSDVCCYNNSSNLDILSDPSLCPTISVTSTLPSLTSTVSDSSSPSSSFYDYSSSHITHSPSVTATFFTSSMPPSPSSIISSSSCPTCAPSFTSYSSATAVSSFSLFSPTISPSPLLCPAENQWQETAAGQNVTGTCYKGTFNGQFDQLCYIYIVFIFSLATRHCNDSGEWSEINCITSEEFEAILSLVESCHHNDAFKIIIFHILGIFT